MNEGALIIGLGNPGPRYERNRHNFGFMVLDELLSRTGPAGWHEKFSGQMARVQLGRIPCTLLKPMTYMNLSGRSVSRAAQFFRYDVTDLIVIHDEVDLPFETVRIKDGGGTAGHKGLASIKQSMGETNFIRVRMGVGRPVHGDVSDFVLSDFNSDETITLADIVKLGADAVQTIVAEGTTKAMNAFNQKR